MNVAPDELSGTEQAVLLVLMAESRPVPNAELERLGPKLDKPKRDRLNRLGLIESTGTRPLVHELTDTGWALCRSLFGADAPPRSTGQGKALYTLLSALHRYFEHAELVPADVFLPAEEPTEASPQGIRPGFRSRSRNPAAYRLCRPDQPGPAAGSVCCEAASGRTRARPAPPSTPR